MKGLEDDTGPNIISGKTLGMKGGALGAEEVVVVVAGVVVAAVVALVVVAFVVVVVAEAAVVLVKRLSRRTGEMLN